MGGTNRFIRRPYIHSGALLGLLGTAASLALLLGIKIYAHQELEQLSALYNDSAIIAGLSPLEILLFLIFGTLFGAISARITLAQLLHTFEPK